jgi:hypothetical protein
MADWVVVPCLVRLRAEFNTIAPDRDKASDGTIGDAAHSSSSDHTPDEISDALRGKDPDKVNEVHALDVDADLRVPGFSMERAVQHLLERCRSGAELRLRYIIFNRRIWSESTGWRQQAYAGPNDHSKHAHFSSSYIAAREASMASYHLQEAVPVTAPTADQNAAAAAGRDVDPSAGTQSWGGAAWTTLIRTGYLANQWAPAVSAEIDALQARIDDQSDDMDALGATLALLMFLIGQVTNEPAAGDPNVWYDVMRKAVSDELDARNMTGSGVE